MTLSPAPVARQNQLAIAAFVLGFAASVGGIICGHLALAQIGRTGEQGRGLALTGLIVGYVSTAFWLLVVILWPALYILFFVGLVNLGLGDHPS